MAAITFLKVSNKVKFVAPKKGILRIYCLVQSVQLTSPANNLFQNNIPHFSSNNWLTQSITPKYVVIYEQISIGIDTHFNGLTERSVSWKPEICSGIETL